MKSLTILFAISAAVAILAATIRADFDEEPHVRTNQAPLRRFLAWRYPKHGMTCDRFPRICRREKGSPGPDCCRKKCVNVKKDRFNCGMCGYKCKYGEICCRGQCVNASFDKRNCGGCNNKCKRGELCVYGMCNYA
ncbi:hypothetical protein F3Y22_tig00111542pilonHSYRG00103 [Hibiscus syriacus]|uniref:Stigma-specific STIG1-like protein 1 n=1 Tax=Hibiscus syriacus TaxID=106335 RepID=A0A6A2YE10_HIBSY|nr:stigma-specific STIG1-like protein 1 [Hibiscus syriacus]KAE8677186.1 hypothetical protein F3Y22_tig00111542pilonHSYRG00103 [Hibiscus syriacus]